MNNEEPMCYITYAVPARLLPNISLMENGVPAQIQPAKREEEPPMLYPPGFMPDWFLNGKFPEDEE